MRKKFRVEITASAERDVLAIRDFIARDKPRAGDKWARLIVRQIRSLKSMPQRFSVDELGAGVLPQFADWGLLEDAPYHVRLTRRGLLVSDAMWPKLLRQ